MASPLRCARSGAAFTAQLRPATRSSPLPVVCRRYLNEDVRITRTGKPILTVSGGRSSLGGYTATVFGATGFLGRYIVNRLARQGVTCIIPFREEMAKRHLKVAGDLGKVIFMEMDLRNTASIEESVRHSDIVYNLIGRDYPTKNFDLEDVHVHGVERIAEAVAKYDIDRFVHVSSHSAHLESPAEFYRTKAQGEQVARSIYPETTIVRPGPMFGFEDRLLNRLAGATNVITSNNMQEYLWPVHVVDIATALEHMLNDDNTAGETYELYGPNGYTMAELNELVSKEIYRQRRHVNVPPVVLKPVAHYLNKLLWWPIHSAQEVEREFVDMTVDPNAKTFADLGIEPVDIKSMLYEYLKGYRSSQYYDLPPMTEREKREEKKYLHVIDDQ